HEPRTRLAGFKPCEIKGAGERAKYAGKRIRRLLLGRAGKIGLRHIAAAGQDLAEWPVPLRADLLPDRIVQLLFLERAHPDQDPADSQAVMRRGNLRDLATVQDD